MALIFQDWMVQNTQRKYPIDDHATGVDDDGGIVREDVIADLHLMVPWAAPHVFVSSIAVTSHAVSVTFLGSTAPAVPADPAHPGHSGEFVPLALFSAPKPVVPFRNYPLQPVVPGVRGWIAFGGIVASGDTASHKISTPEQGAVCPKAVRVYTPAPVPSVGVQYNPARLTGDITFLAEAPLRIEERMVGVGEESVKAFVFSLDGTLDTYQAFAPVCFSAPFMGTCGRVPIRAINGVTPDSSGNITLKVKSLPKWGS